MSLYLSIVSPRTTIPDKVALVTQLQAQFGPTASLVIDDPQHYRLKKSTDWTAPQIAGVQSAIDAAPAITPQRVSQNYIDSMPVFERARCEMELDEFNRLRAALRALGAPGLPALTLADVVATWRAKAGV